MREGYRFHMQTQCKNPGLWGCFWKHSGALCSCTSPCTCTCTLSYTYSSVRVTWTSVWLFLRAVKMHWLKPLWINPIKQGEFPRDTKRSRFPPLTHNKAARLLSRVVPWWQGRLLKTPTSLASATMSRDQYVKRGGAEWECSQASESKTWVQILILPLIGCVITGKLHDLS